VGGKTPVDQREAVARLQRDTAKGGSESGQRRMCDSVLVVKRETTDGDSSAWRGLGKEQCRDFAGFSEFVEWV